MIHPNAPRGCVPCKTYINLQPLNGGRYLPAVNGVLWYKRMLLWYTASFTHTYCRPNTRILSRRGMKRQICGHWANFDSGGLCCGQTPGGGDYGWPLPNLECYMVAFQKEWCWFNILKGYCGHWCLGFWRKIPNINTWVLDKRFTINRRFELFVRYLDAQSWIFELLKLGILSVASPCFGSD